MNTIAHAHHRPTPDERFRRLLAAWLAALHPDRWKGTAAQLFEALDDLERAGKFFAFVPSASALTKALQCDESSVRAAGFALTVGRTKSARFVAFRRLPVPNAVASAG